MAVTTLFALPFGARADEYRNGIDISENNGDFDLDASINQGSSFVMIRLGYFTHLDKYFLANVEKAVNAGLDFGVYLYSYAFDGDEALQEAQFVIDTLSSLEPEQLEHMTLPVAYDLEVSEILDNCNKSQITGNMVLFCDKIRDAGYTPMVYANQDWFTNYIDLATAYNKGYKLWFAFYPSGTPDLNAQKEIGSTGYYADMWQYSNTNKTLDKNIMYPSMLCGKHRFSKSGTVAPSCTAMGYDLSKCANCGCLHKDNFKAKLAHKYTTAKATLSKNGIVKCSVCGYVKQTISYPKTIALSATSYTYDGKVKKPTVTVKGADGKVISASNYTVTYANGRKLVGKYAVKITFKGNYSGTKTLYFTIKPKNTSILSLTSGSKRFTVKLKKYTTQTTGYQVQYSTNSSFKNAKTVTMKNTATSKTISKLAGKKKYYVRVRTYKKVGSANYYSVWSAKKAVTTKNKLAGD